MAFGRTDDLVWLAAGGAHRSPVDYGEYGEYGADMVFSPSLS
jgi:hypothetical protein